ncbi:MAG: hypothetical protein ABIZ80_01110, partial [Bryobacteraceae bacterium]
DSGRGVKNRGAGLDTQMFDAAEIQPLHQFNETALGCGERGLRNRLIQSSMLHLELKELPDEWGWVDPRFRAHSLTPGQRLQ